MTTTLLMKSWKQKEAFDEKEDKKSRVLTFQIEPLRLIMWVLFQRVPFSFGYGVWKIAWILGFPRKDFSTECRARSRREMANYSKIFKPRQTFTFIHRPKMYRTLWGSFGSPKIGKSTTPSPKILAANGHTLHFRLATWDQLPSTHPLTVPHPCLSKRPLSPSWYVVLHHGRVWIWYR